MIKVGAATEPEMKEKKARVEDALHATRAAVEEGFIAGGGVALIRCIDKIDKLDDLPGDQRFGVKIVQKALEEPLRQIAVNAGLEGGIVVEKVKSLKGSQGFNAATEELRGPPQGGHHRPTKVTRFALQNALLSRACCSPPRSWWQRPPRRRRRPPVPAACPTAWTT